MMVEKPFTHMTGGQRWDLRVTITYRDAPSAEATGEAGCEEENRRFSLLEEHWDVIVTPYRD